MLFYFVVFRLLSLSLLMILKVFCKILVLFWLVQNFGLGNGKCWKSQCCSYPTTTVLVCFQIIQANKPKCFNCGIQCHMTHSTPKGQMCGTCHQVCKMTVTKWPLADVLFYNILLKIAIVCWCFSVCTFSFEINSKWMLVSIESEKNALSFSSDSPPFIQLWNDTLQ